MQGYEIGQQPGAYHFYLSSKYIQWQDHNYSVRVGDIFDQFGSGLIFRSFEDRQLGFNNSIEGVQGIYRFGDYVEVKGMYGRPRLYTDYADSWVRGADLHISLNDISVGTLRSSRLRAATSTATSRSTRIRRSTSPLADLPRPT